MRCSKGPGLGSNSGGCSKDSVLVHGEPTVHLFFFDFFMCANPPSTSLFHYTGAKIKMTIYLTQYLESIM